MMMLRMLRASRPDATMPDTSAQRLGALADQVKTLEVRLAKSQKPRRPASGLPRPS